jgi:hypothetical protein
MEEVEERSLAGRGLRRWAIVALSAVAAAILLYLGAAALLRAFLDPESLAEWVEPRAEAALNREVELDGVRLFFFPGFGAELQGIEVKNLPEFGGPPLARVERVRLRVALLPLLRRRIEVGEVRVEDPVLRLMVDADGRTNYGDLAPEPEDPPAEAREAPADLAIRALRVSGGRLEYESVPDSLAVVLDGITVRASLDLLRDGNWSVASRSAAPEVRVLHPALGEGPRAFRSVALEADARAGPEFRWLEVDRGTLHLEDADFSVTGRMEDLMEPVRQVALELRADRLDVPRFFSFLPDELRASLPGRPEGTLNVVATLQGPLGVDVRPDLRGTVAIAAAGLRAPDDRALAEGLDGRIELHNDSIGIQGIRGRVLDGAFSLTAVVRNEPDFPFWTEIEAASRLERIQLIGALPDGVDVAGLSDTRLTVRGHALRPAEATVDGTVDVAGLRAVLPALAVPLSVPAGRLAFQGRGLSWDAVGVELGEDRLVTSGTLREYLAVLDGLEDTAPEMQARITSDRLDLDRIFPPKGDDEITYGQLAFARLGGRDLDGRSPEALAREQGFERPEAIPLDGEVRVTVGTLLTAPYHLTDVDALVTFTRDVLQVTEARASLFGGRVRGGMLVGLGPEAEQPFTFSMSVESVQAADFLSVSTPLGENVRGLLGLEMEASGTLDALLLPSATALAGNGRVRVTDGQVMETPVTRLLARSLSRPALANPRFQEWGGPFRIEGSRLVFDETLLALDAAEGEFRYGGGVGMDGSLDLAVRLAAPAARLDSLALARTGMLPAAVGPLSLREGTVRLGLRLGGSLTDPRLTPEASLALGDMRRTLEAEARERADALQAEGERRAQEARDTVGARAEALRDSVAAVRDSLAARAEEERRRLEERAAEEAQRELRERGRGLLQRLRPPPDTTPPDTLRRDTLRTDTLPGPR